MQVPLLAIAYLCGQGQPHENEGPVTTYQTFNGDDQLMKASSLALFLTIFLFASNGHPTHANNRKGTVNKTDTQSILIKEIDQPLNRKEMEIHNKLKALDITVVGFSEGKKYKQLPPTTLKQIIIKEDELKKEYTVEIHKLMGELNETLNELKMKFQQKTDNKNPREINKEINTLRKTVRNELDKSNRKLNAVNLTFDIFRDELIQEREDIDQKKRNQRRRRRRR